VFFYAGGREWEVGGGGDGFVAGMTVGLLGEGKGVKEKDGNRRDSIRNSEITAFGGKWGGSRTLRKGEGSSGGMRYKRDGFAEKLKGGRCHGEEGGAKRGENVFMADDRTTSTLQSKKGGEERKKRVIGGNTKKPAIGHPNLWGDWPRRSWGGERQVNDVGGNSRAGGLLKARGGKLTS